MKTILICCIFAIASVSCSKPEEIHLKLTAEEHSYLECPVAINLDSILTLIPDHLELYEIRANEMVFIPTQQDPESLELLWFLVDGTLLKGESREYILKSVNKKKKAKDGHFRIEDMEDELKLYEADRNILSYRKTELLPPDSVDAIYKRSAFIHPLNSPGGEILTRIQPPDHYHHYGIWAPWTKTFIGDREIDYWNLAKGEGTVRSRAILSKSIGPGFASFLALQEHIDKGYEGGERVTMDEFWEVRYWGLELNKPRYSLDLNSTFRNVLEDTILFEAYRYGGGIGYRSTARWNGENSSVLTSEGHGRISADGTKARWCIIEGESDVREGRSGILFMSHPMNREHPEPMRVWPLDSNDGQLFFEFCPIRHNSWQIIPGYDYTLRYRIIVFDGSMTKEEAEMYWNAFAYPPQITILERNTEN